MMFLEIFFSHTYLHDLIYDNNKNIKNMLYTNKFSPL